MPVLTPCILYEDNSIIVCAKPHGLPVQSRGFGSQDLESALRTYLVQKGETSYLAVIHRLDQPVSGILVFAKTQKAARSLNAQMNSRHFGKFYLAAVDGTPAAPSGQLENYLVKDPRNNLSSVCGRNTPGAKRALLNYRTAPDTAASFFPDCGSENTVLEIQLETGRHHQIRVQLAHMGCPIIGDHKYNPHTQTPGSPRTLSLCAYRLTFPHPDTQKMLSFSLDHDVTP